jgi:hypothetical protein
MYNKRNAIINIIIIITFSRRYGGLENGRFCFEGGSRCGKGEGVHVLRLDDPEDLQLAFDAAAKGKLESKRKSVYKTSNYFLLYKVSKQLEQKGCYIKLAGHIRP